MPDIKQQTENTPLERENRVVDFMISQLKSWTLSDKAGDEALRLLLDMADDGNIHAQYRIGRYAMENPGKIRSRDKGMASAIAEHYLTRATEQGHKAAQLQLAIFYQKKGEHEKLPKLLKPLVIGKKARCRRAC